MTTDLTDAELKELDERREVRVCDGVPYMMVTVEQWDRLLAEVRRRRAEGSGVKVIRTVRPQFEIQEDEP